MCERISFTKDLFINLTHLKYLLYVKQTWPLVSNISSTKNFLALIRMFLFVYLSSKFLSKRVYFWLYIIFKKTQKSRCCALISTSGCIFQSYSFSPFKTNTPTILTHWQIHMHYKMGDLDDCRWSMTLDQYLK